jgi:hypothetical protein
MEAERLNGIGRSACLLRSASRDDNIQVRRSCNMYPSSILRGFGAVLFTSILASTAPGQTVLFFDTFDPVSPVPDPGCDNSVGGSIPSQWLTQPDQINGFLTQRLFSSDKCHRKNHTGPITEGGSAFEVDSNPYPFAMFRSFDEQTGTLRVGVGRRRVAQAAVLA